MCNTLQHNDLLNKLIYYFGQTEINLLGKLAYLATLDNLVNLKRSKSIECGTLRYHQVLSGTLRYTLKRSTSTTIQPSSRAINATSVSSATNATTVSSATDVLNCFNGLQQPQRPSKPQAPNEPLQYQDRSKQCSYRLKGQEQYPQGFGRSTRSKA